MECTEQCSEEAEKLTATGRLELKYHWTSIGFPFSPLVPPALDAERARNRDYAQVRTETAPRGTLSFGSEERKTGLWSQREKGKPPFFAFSTSPAPRQSCSHDGGSGSGGYSGTRKAPYLWLQQPWTNSHCLFSSLFSYHWVLEAETAGPFLFLHLAFHLQRACLLLITFFCSPGIFLFYTDHQINFHPYISCPW